MGDCYGMKQIKTENIKEIKKGWHNMVLKKPLKGCENSNIQYIIEVNGDYGVASIKPMTLKEINNINLDDWHFRPFKEILKESN